MSSHIRGLLAKVSTAGFRNIVLAFQLAAFDPTTDEVVEVDMEYLLDEVEAALREAQLLGRPPRARD